MTKQQQHAYIAILSTVLSCLIAAIIVLGVTAAHAGPTVPQKCEAGVNKAAGTLANDLYKAAATLAVKGDQAEHDTKATTAVTKYDTKVSKVLTKAQDAGEPCAAADAADSIVSKVVEIVQKTEAIATEGRYSDHANGTVTDNTTGLMWQKTDDLDGITDKDSFYGWVAVNGQSEPTGTAFTTFLGTLNGAVDGICFAGHCDWRLPSVSELETLLLEPYPCSQDPCLDQAVFGPISGTPNYFSSTTNAGNSTQAWYVWFGGGAITLFADKTTGAFNTLYRAVRDAD